MTDSPSLPFPRIEVDLDRYWRQFCAAHGGDFVRYGNRYLFKDGWTHSVKSKHGPAWPPGDNERELKRVYWETRLHAVRSQCSFLARKVYSVSNLRQSLEVGAIPLRLWGTVEDEKTGKTRRGWQDITEDDLRGMIERLNAEIRECERELVNLEGVESD